jgi:hypothetical protein
MSNDCGHYQGSYSERKECGVIGAYGLVKLSDHSIRFSIGMEEPKKQEACTSFLLWRRI